MDNTTEALASQTPGDKPTAPQGVVGEHPDSDFIDRYRLLRKLAHPLEGPFVITIEGEDGALYGSYLDAELDKRLAALTPSPAPSAAQHQGADALREALAELVALKDMKERFQWNGEWTSNRNRNEYAKRQPIAWAAARAALAQHQAPQQGEQHE